MKRTWPLAVLFLLILLVGGCSISITPLVSSHVISAGSSDSPGGTFLISWSCVNNGSSAIAISAATLGIRGSLGQTIAFTQTGSSLAYGVFVNPGNSYSYTISGYGNSFVPYFFDSDITFTDGLGNFYVASETATAFDVF